MKVDSKALSFWKMTAGSSLLALSGGCTNAQTVNPGFSSNQTDQSGQNKEALMKRQDLLPVDTTAEESDSQIFCYVTEEMPKFPGGDAELLKYVQQQVDLLWPVAERKDSISKRVILSFVVDTTGKVVDAEVIRGANPYVDSIAVKIVSGMPRWVPGKQRGKVVRVKYTVPITFRWPDR